MKYNELLTANDIINLLTKRLNFSLKPKGKSIFFPCPFHNDNNPSFSFDPTRKIFKCFSCHNFNQGKVGDIFIFWAQYKKISVEQALEEIGRLGYFSLTSWQETKKNQEKSREKIFEFCSLITNIYHHNLFTNNGQKVLEYLQKKRHLNIELINSFSLGGAIHNQQLTNLFYFENKTDFSLFAQNFTSLWCLAEDNRVYDFFSAQQLIFPLSNEEGKIVSWAARKIEIIPGESKYKYLPNHPHYQKSGLLYNYVNVKHNPTLECYLVEGFFDVISLTRLGVRNCLAILGTSLSDKQIRLLTNLKKRIILFLDSDRAGQEATVHIIIDLLLREMDCEVIKPNYQGDPDDICCHHDPAVVYQLLEQRENPYTFILNHYYQQLKIKENPQRISCFIEEIAAIFRKFKINTRNFLIEKISQLINWKKEEVEVYFFTPNFPSLPLKQWLVKACQNQISEKEKELLFFSTQSRDYWMLLVTQNYFFNDKTNRHYYQSAYNYYISSPHNQCFISPPDHRLIIKKKNNIISSNEVIMIKDICQQINHIKKFQQNYEKK